MHFFQIIGKTYIHDVSIYFLLIFSGEKMAELVIDVLQKFGQEEKVVLFCHLTIIIPEI